MRPVLNHDSLAAVAAARRDPEYAVPLYDGYGFASVPRLIRALLTGDADTGVPAAALGDLPRRADNLVLFLVDGFGWSFFDRFADLPFLARFLADGVASKITSQFPATTAAHMTTLHTGAPSAESGVFEWFYHEPLLGQIFAPLLAVTVGPERTIPVREDRLAALYPATTLYEQLAAAGVRCRLYQSAQYARSPYSKAVTRGAEPCAYRTLPELMVNLAEAVRTSEGKAYHCVYIDVVDHLSHAYGPAAPQLAAEIRSLFGQLEQFFLPGIAGARQPPTLLLAADHGQTAVDPARTIYLDQLLPGSPRWLRTTSDGRPLRPAGSPRDVFLYVRDEHLLEAEQALAAALAGRAAVHRTRALLDAGVFGPNPSPRLVDRAGDLVILPHAHEMVWWWDAARFALDKRGHHGGLGPEELETPLLALAL